MTIIMDDADHTIRDWAYLSSLLAPSRLPLPYSTFHFILLAGMVIVTIVTIVIVNHIIFVMIMIMIMIIKAILIIMQSSYSKMMKIIS